jgi:hypothetical protein
MAEELFVLVRRNRKANDKDTLGPYNKEGISYFLPQPAYEEYDVYPLGSKVVLTEVPVVTTTYKRFWSS